MATAGDAGLDVTSLTPVYWVGIALALVSGGIHVRLGIGNLPSGLGVSFLLAGLGFLGAVGLVVAGYRRRTVSAAGIPFTLVQVVAWYWLNFAAGPKSFPAGTPSFVIECLIWVAFGSLVVGPRLRTRLSG